MIPKTGIIILSVLALSNLTYCTAARTSSVDSGQASRYDNQTYGYSLIVPPGLTAISERSPSPQHGIKLPTSANPLEFIWTDGSFNVASWLTLKDGSDAHLKWLAEDMQAVMLLRQDSVALGPLKASRTVLQYEDPATKTAMIEDFLLAMRDVKGEVSIVYTIGLRTKRNDYDKQKGLLDDTISGWELRPIE